MSEGYWFAPETEETSYLNTLPLNSKLSTEVRMVRNIYRNEDNGYSVYDVEDIEHHWFKLTGYFPAALRLDIYYAIDGTVKDGRYGRTLDADSYRSVLPHNEEGILTILRTLPRLDTRAMVVYQELGDDALDLILEDPAQVSQRIKGVSLSMAEAWQSSLRNLKESDVLLQVLQDYQIPVTAAKKLIETYPDIIERLRRSPYFLIDEVRGFSFVKCDKIALQNGYPLDGQERLQQAMLYVLSQSGMANGDCYMVASDFTTAVRKLVDVRIDYRTACKMLKSQSPLSLEMGTHTFPVNRQALTDALQKWRKAPSRTFSYICKEIPAQKLEQAMNLLRSGNKLVLEEDRVYLGYIYQAETTVARCLKAMTASEYGHFDDAEQVLNDICVEENIELEKQQRAAVLRFCHGRGGVFVLNGRAGCGKTFTLNIIIKVLKELYRRQGLYFSAKIMAPTGKAAQVAHNSTNLPACTVHRELHLVADGGMNTDVSIDGECVVIDEFSMMGLTLSSALLRAIKPGVKVIIMGDFEQLPSIDPGNVLHDIIASETIPVVTLDVVKRQAEGSGILYNANQILNGSMIRSMVVNQESTVNNAYVMKADTEYQCCDKILRMVLQMRQKGYSMDDIQVLCPQKKTAVGIDALNYFIQQQINPANGRKELLSKQVEIASAASGIQTVNLMFREGDKVIHTANDYEMKFYTFQKGEGFVEDFERVGIVNGETGRIAKILEVKDGKTTHRRIYVLYGDRYAMYEDDWSNLSMAYAMTIHRAQGSQWPVVISPIMFCNRGMLNRKLFYTLYTRAQKTSVVYGTTDSIAYAIKNNITAKRNTWLTERLRQA